MLVAVGNKNGMMYSFGLSDLKKITSINIFLKKISQSHLVLLKRCHTNSSEQVNVLFQHRRVTLSVLMKKDTTIVKDIEFSFCAILAITPVLI